MMPSTPPFPHSSTSSRPVELCCTINPCFLVSCDTCVTYNPEDAPRVDFSSKVLILKFIDSAPFGTWSAHPHPENGCEDYYLQAAISMNGFVSRTVRALPLACGAARKRPQSALSNRKPIAVPVSGGGHPCCHYPRRPASLEVSAGGVGNEEGVASWRISRRLASVALWQGFRLCDAQNRKTRLGCWCSVGVRPSSCSLSSHVNVLSVCGGTPRRPAYRYNSCPLTWEAFEDACLRLGFNHPDIVQ